jgi:hypothetical protein
MNSCGMRSFAKSEERIKEKLKKKQRERKDKAAILKIWKRVEF